MLDLNERQELSHQIGQIESMVREMNLPPMETGQILKQMECLREAWLDGDYTTPALNNWISSEEHEKAIHEQSLRFRAVNVAAVAAMVPEFQEAALRAENARLMEALKPFATSPYAEPSDEPFGLPGEHPVVSHPTADEITVEDFRRARAATTLTESN